MAAHHGNAPHQAPDNAVLAGLVQAVVDRDEAALARLYDLTAERVYSLARTMTGNDADAEEVVCDVYLQVWERAVQYEESRGPVIAWLLIQCRSLALDLLRRHRAQQAGREKLAMTATDAGIDLDDVLDSMQEGTAVHRALSELSEVQRRLIALAFFKDLSHQEIAAAVELPLGTVKSHIRRGLKILRTHLNL